MAKKHTPGPWQAEFTDVPYEELGETWTVEAAGSAICTLDGPSDEREANARLIAVAPQMFALLKAMHTSATMTRGKDPLDYDRWLREVNALVEGIEKEGDQ